MSARHVRATASGMALALVSLGCGGDGGEEVTREARPGAVEPKPYRGQIQRQVVKDARRDVRVIADDEAPPTRDALDLAAVSLRRQGGRLRVEMRTVAPPAPPMEQHLIVFGPRRLLEATIVAEHRRDGTVRGVLRPVRRSSRPLDVRVRGRSVIVTTALTSLMRADRFRWQARVVTKGEIVDQVPDPRANVASFPF